MFKQIMTLVRGRAHEAEQSFLDRNALTLLSQQIRDAASAIQSARRAVAVATAHDAQEKDRRATIAARLADLETRAVAALEMGREDLAREAAAAIAFLETERAACDVALGQYAATIDKLRGVVRAAEARLRDLQRGERLARVNEQARSLDDAGASAGLAALDEAEETLARLRLRQTQNDVTAAVLGEMRQGSGPSAIIERLAGAGCGAPLQTSADAVLSRLKRQMNSAA